MKPTHVALLLAASVVAGLFARHVHRKNDATRTALRSLQETHSSHEAGLHAAADRLAHAKQAAADLRARSHAVPPEKTVRPPAPPAPDLSHLIDDNPKLQLLQLAARRAQLVITYGPFYRRAALTPAQIAAFEKNFIRREERRADLFATASAEHTKLTDPAYQKLFADVQSEYQTAQRELLGETTAKLLANFDRTAATREIVASLAGATAMAGLPLDSDQAEQLTRVIAAATRPPSSEPARGPVVDWNAVHEQASAFLSASQLTFIETTEAAGPRGTGGRFLPALHAAIDAAAREENTSAAKVSVTSP